MVPGTKHSWYQTRTHVVVDVFVKNRREGDVKVEVTRELVEISIKLDSGSEFVWSLRPFLPLCTTDYGVSLSWPKVEIKLKKEKVGQWEKLETDEEVGAEPAPKEKKEVNWDEIAKEADKDAEGDALQKLFQDIYARSDEATRRAMNKSYVESGGTVLSTNWSEVGASEVKPQPPDGMEVRK